MATEQRSKVGHRQYDETRCTGRASFRAAMAKYCEALKYKSKGFAMQIIALHWKCVEQNCNGQAQPSDAREKRSLAMQGKSREQRSKGVDQHSYAKLRTET